MFMYGTGKETSAWWSLWRPRIFERKKRMFGPAGIVPFSLSGDYSPAESTTDWLRGNLGIFSSRKWVSLRKYILFTCRSHLRHYQRLWFVFLWPDGFVSDVPASIIKLLQNWRSIFFLFSHSVITGCRWLCFLASVLALEFCCILLSLWNIHTLIITSLGEEVLMQLENMPRPLSSKTVTQLPQNVLNWTNVDQAM